MDVFVLSNCGTPMRVFKSEKVGIAELLRLRAPDKLGDCYELTTVPFEDE